MASFPVLLLLAAVAAPHAYGWSYHAPRSAHRPGGRARPASMSAFGSIESSSGACAEDRGCDDDVDDDAAALTTTALRLHSRADFLFSGAVAAVSAGALLLATPSSARAAEARKGDAPPQDVAAAALRSGLDSLEREKKKVDKAVKKETKAVKKEIKKMDKAVKKETKVVKKEIKKIDKTVKKETKKMGKTVKKETEKARREVDKGAKVVGREAKNIGDAVGKGTQSLVGGGSGSGDGGASSPARNKGIDVSRLKTCDDPRGKCL